MSAQEKRESSKVIANLLQKNKFESKTKLKIKGNCQNYSHNQPLAVRTVSMQIRIYVEGGSIIDWVETLPSLHGSEQK